MRKFGTYGPDIPYLVYVTMGGFCLAYVIRLPAETEGDAINAAWSDYLRECEE